MTKSAELPNDEFRAEAREIGKSKLRLVKKTEACRWRKAAISTGQIGPTLRQGPANTFMFKDHRHPWTKIHESHEVWFSDR